MTCVAVHAVVYISADFRVFEVGRVVAAMTASACEDGVVRGARVAGGANPIGIAMVERKEGVVAVGQGCRQPGSRRVAGRAGGRPASCDVIGICGSGKIRLMARVASGRCSRKDIVDVALDAVDGSVRTGEGEGRAVVIEGCPRPGGCGVASVAGGGEARRCMCRISGSVPIRRMAAVAGSGQGCVVAVYVTRHTGHGCVSAREGECGGGVIEGGRSPVGG